MKTRFFNLMTLAAMAACTMMTGCNDEKADQLQKERDSLAELTSSQALAINEVNSTLGEISLMMDSISLQENALFIINNDKNEVQNRHERIKGNIKNFEDMLKRHKARIAELEARLDGNSKETANLKNIIQLMKSQIEQKDKEIQNLRTQLEKSNKNVLELRQNVTSLNAITQTQRSQIAEQQETISSQEEALSAQDKMLNQGYVLVATKKELKDLGIRTGGNLFKKSKTNLNNLPTGRFKEVDIRNFKQLNIQGKKVSLLSPAPNSSYSLLKEGSSYKLVINDPTSFWSISNYLVIQAD